MHHTDPEHIAIAKSSGITIDWKDGHRSEYSLKYLRDHCPCATCAETHGPSPAAPAQDNPLQLYKPKLKMEKVEPVGQYAIRMHWNDGHNAGIYSYDYFREICPCVECAPPRA